MKVKKEIKNAASNLGINKIKHEQKEPIERILDGEDALVIYPVGFGKSAIAQIPALINQKRPTIIFEPTISLMYDQARHLQEHGIRAAYVASRNAEEHDVLLEKYAKGEIPILYVAPERLKSEAFFYAVHQNPPWLVVADEAHCVLEWGRSFRPDYQEIGAFVSSQKKRPCVLAMTATAPKEYRSELIEELHMENPVIYTASLYRPNLTLICERMEIDKTKSRCHHIKTLIMRYGQKGRVVVYCTTKRDADMAYNYLSEKFPAEVAKCHAFLNPEKRAKQEMQFLTGKRRIMIATTAFGMGVDVPDIRLIIHFSMPISPIGYYQEVGRAGRDNEPSHCVMLYHPDDAKKFSKILKTEEKERGKKARERIEAGIYAMQEIAEGDDCIMMAVLKYLDDEPLHSCGKCSACQRKRRSQDVRD